MNWNNPNNFYQNSPYINGNIQYVPNISTQQPLTFTTQSQQATMPATVLNGKIVDSADVVKATEVPIGGYGIFPKADLSEIYTKIWNNNGTTSIITFKPDILPNPTPVEQQQAMVDVTPILEKISILESKLDAALIAAEKMKSTPKKEITANDY